MKQQPTILLISNITSKMKRGKAVCESLAEELSTSGWNVMMASGKLNPIRRLVEMLSVAWIHRKQYQVAYIEVYSGKSFIWAESVSTLLRYIGKTFVLALYGGNLPIFSRENPKRVRHLLNSATAVISPSEYIRQSMSNYCDHIQILPYGINLDEFQYRHRTRIQPKLLTWRAFHYMYNLDLAPRVLAKVIEKHPQAQLDMVGGDKGDGSLELTKQTALEAGVFERVHIHGFVPHKDLYATISQSDILLNTTRVDNTPVSLIEGMACGLCIVSTNVGGVPFLVEDNHDGLLVPAGDVDAMAKAVCRILEEPQLSSRLSEAAYKKALNYDWKVLLPKWKQLLHELSR